MRLLLTGFSALLQVAVSLPLFAQPASRPLPFEEGTLTVAAIRELLTDSSKVKVSLETLLEVIPKQVLSEPVLVYKSLSLQQASPKYPRVILSANNSQLLLAFNGDKAARNFQTLEMIEFNRQSAAFDFYQVTFKDDGPAVFSEKNPPICLTCHRSDPRPNWDAYDFWDGVYGSLFDSRRRDDIDEEEMLKTFASEAKENVRYKHLAGFESIGSLSERNNAFTKQLAKLNYQRLARFIRTSPDYGKFKYAILYAVSAGCTDVLADDHVRVDGLLSDKARQAMTHDLDYYEADTRRIAQELEDREAKVGRPTVLEFFAYRGIAGLRYLFEGRGISVADWAMPLARDTYHFTAGDSYGVSRLAQVLIEQDPDFAFVGPSGGGIGLEAESCSKVRRASLAAFGQMVDD